MFALLSTLKKDTAKYGSTEWFPVRFSSPSCCSTTDQIFTLQKISVKSWECGKDVYTCFVDLLEKSCDRVPCEKLWLSKAFPGLRSGHLISAQKFVSVSKELNNDRPPLVLDSDQGLCCHHSFSESTSMCIEWTVTAGSTRVSQLGAARLTLYFFQTIWYC